MKKRYLTLLALLLSAGLAAPACGGDDDDDNQTQDDDDDNQQGAGGGGNQQGSGGGGNQQGSGGGGNQQGSGGGGNQQGNAGSGGGGPGKALAAVLELTGGDVDNDESLELFPFGAAVARDGSVFVSTLGNNDDIRSRIYKFEPGASSAPKLYFEANAQADNAVYGLAISDDNKLYACIAPHLLANSALPSTIYRFDSLDVAGQNNAGFQSRVLNTSVEVDADAGEAQDNGNNIVLDQCTNIVFDNSNNLYVADAFGTSNAIFRLNMDAFDDNPPPEVEGGDVTVQNYQDLLTTAWLIDNVNVGGGNGTEFGVSGIAVSGGSLFFIRQDDNNTLFSVGLSGDFPDSNVADDGTDILQDVNEPSFIAASNDLLFVSSLVDDKVVVLRNNNGDKQATTLIDANTVNDVNSFVNPSAIAIQGNQGLVVASQVEALLVGNIANDVFRLYSFNVPSQ